MGLLRRKNRESDLGPATLLPAGDPGCWLVRPTATADTPEVRLPVSMPAQDLTCIDAPTPVAAMAADEARPARARLAALTANLSV